MKVDNIQSMFQGSIEPQKSKSTKPSDKSSAKTDRAEISSTAQAMNAAASDQRLGAIQGKIDSGFYNKDEVIESVAESVLKYIRANP